MVSRGALESFIKQRVTGPVLDLEEAPQPLTKLDYKIVVGNSLLSKFEEEVINIEFSTNTAKAIEATRLITTQQGSKPNTLQTWCAAFFDYSGDKAKIDWIYATKKLHNTCLTR